MTVAQMRLLRRAAAVLIMAALVGLVVAAVIMPVADRWSAQTGDIARSERLLAGYRNVIERRPAAEARLAQLRAAEAALPGLIDRPDAAQAATELQNQIRQMFAARGGTIQNLQTVPPVQDHGLDHVELRVEAVLPVGGFADLLDDLDRHVPTLTADPVDISAQDGSLKPSNLIVRLTIGAYRRGSGS